MCPLLQVCPRAPQTGMDQGVREFEAPASQVGGGEFPPRSSPPGLLLPLLLEHGHDPGQLRRRRRRRDR